MKGIFIDGAAGFIGSHLCERLLEKDYRIAGFDNLTGSSIDPKYKWKNIAGIVRNANFHLYEGDIRIKEKLEMPFFWENIDTVVHLAAQTGVRPSVQDPILHYKTNVIGLVNVLQLCVRYGIKNLVFASSSSVYGDNPHVPFVEGDKADSPLSPYAATKKAGENICHVFHKIYGMNIACLRPFTVYGPRQRKDMAISLFTRKIYNGEKITLFGDVSNSRDYTYVDDVVSGIIGAIEHNQGYEIYNIGGGKPISLAMLVRLIESRLGKEAEVEYSPMQVGEAHHTFACINKARRMLGYGVTVGIEEGLSRYIDWFIKEQEYVQARPPC